MPRNVAVGVGLMEFPFSGADAYWRWVDLCEAGGVDSIWQTDRLVSPSPFLECMSAHGGARRAHQADQVRRQRIVIGDARRGAGGAAMRDDRFSVERAAAAGLRHRQPARRRNGRRSTSTPKTRGRKTDEGLEVIRRLWSQDKVDFEGVHYQLSRRLDRAEAGAARSADVDRRLVRGGDPAHRAARHRLAGRAGDPGAGQPRWSPRSSSAAAAEGRTIDDDHYGAGIPFRFGSARRPGARAAVRRLPQAHRARPEGLFRDRRRRGDRRARSPTMSRPASRNSSCARRPGATTRCMAQTRRLIEEVLPRVAAAGRNQRERRAAAE